MYIFILFVACVILPPIFWFLICLREDRGEPEPLKNLFLAFFIGMLSSALAIYGNELVDYLLGLSFGMAIGDLAMVVTPMLLISYFMAGPIEESIKLFVVKETLFYKKDWNELRDGVIYAMTCALGFSFVENAIYFLNEVSLGGDLPDIFVLAFTRALLSILIHLLATGVCGLYLGRAKIYPEKKWKLIFQGLFFASLIHGLSNVLLFVGGYIVIFEFFAYIIGIIVFFKKVNIENDLLKIKI